MISGAYGLWHRINPAKEVKPLQREEPPRPQCLETNGREGKMAELSVYTMNNNMYQGERKNLAKVFDYIVEHISPELYQAVVPMVVDHHPWTLLRKLQERVAPTRTERIIQVLHNYNELRKTPRKEDVLTWCDDWEKMLVQAQKCNLFDAHDKIAIVDFLMAIRPRYEEFAAAGLKAISIPELAGRFTLNEFIYGIRYWERNSETPADYQGSVPTSDTSAQGLRGSGQSEEDIKAELRTQFKDELEKYKKQLRDSAKRREIEEKARIMATVRVVLEDHLDADTQALMGAIHGRLDRGLSGIQHSLGEEVGDTRAITKAELHTAFEIFKREVEEINRRQLQDLRSHLDVANATLVREVGRVKSEIESQRREHEAQFENQRHEHEVKLENQRREHEAKLGREIQELKNILEETAKKHKTPASIITNSTVSSPASSPTLNTACHDSSKIIHKDDKRHWSLPPCPCGGVHYYSKCLYINKKLRMPGWVPDQDVMQRVQTHRTDPVNEDKVQRSLETWKKWNKQSKTTRKESAGIVTVPNKHGDGDAESVSDGVPLWPKVPTERVKV
ncbi:hypothetical protein HDK77DRAFT_428774 [Phyllosticta capitalensis]